MIWFYECLNGATLRDSRPVDWLPHIDSLLVYTYYVYVYVYCIEQERKAGPKLNRENKKFLFFFVILFLIRLCVCTQQI